MKKLAWIPLFLVALATGGCFKLSSDSTVRNDGSATVKLSMAYKTEILETMKSQIDAAIEMMGEDNPEIAKAKEGIEQMEAAFNDKKAAEEWKKHGLEVGKSSMTDKDGWKGLEIEGTVKNLAEYNKKLSESKKPAKAADDGPMGGDAGRFAMPRLPKFYKTDQPNVAKVVMSWRDSDKQDPKLQELENMSDEERSQVEAQLEGARAQIGLDDMKIEMRVKLPGKILSVSNAKQDGDTLVFQMLGSTIGVDTLSKMNQSPSATLQFDPKEFKIPLEDEPKAAESKPASQKAERPKKDEEEKKKEEDK